MEHVKVRRHERGQSTVEFMLMLPLLLASFFFVIEMSMYFSSVHYTQYATFAAARGAAVGEDPEEIASILLTGNVYQGGQNYTVQQIDGDTGVSITLDKWNPSFPFLAGIFPDNGGKGLTFTTEVHLGPRECAYEGKTRGGPFDNNNGCTN